MSAAWLFRGPAQGSRSDRQRRLGLEQVIRTDDRASKASQSHGGPPRCSLPNLNPPSQTQSPALKPADRSTNVPKYGKKPSIRPQIQALPARNCVFTQSKRCFSARHKSNQAARAGAAKAGPLLCKATAQLSRSGLDRAEHAATLVPTSATSPHAVSLFPPTKQPPRQQRRLPNRPKARPHTHPPNQTCRKPAPPSHEATKFPSQTENPRPPTQAPPPHTPRARPSSMIHH